MYFAYYAALSILAGIIAFLIAYIAVICLTDWKINKIAKVDACGWRDFRVGVIFSLNAENIMPRVSRPVIAFGCGFWIVRIGIEILRPDTSQPEFPLK